MHPSNERWIENSKKREDIENIEVYENQKKQMEFPNPAEDLMQSLRWSMMKSYFGWMI